MQLLFSYGTLQMEKVQEDTFGRLLQGSSDTLSGYKLEYVTITDAGVLRKSGIAQHPILFATGDPGDTVDGSVFELTDEELAQADAYEVDDYRRISVLLNSGTKAWVYVKK